MSGDALARGAKRATFGPAQVSQEKWESIFGKPGEDTKETVESNDTDRDNQTDNSSPSERAS